jgi:hypothetical protein
LSPLQIAWVINQAFIDQTQDQLLILRAQTGFYLLLVQHVAQKLVLHVEAMVVVILLRQLVCCVVKVALDHFSIQHFVMHLLHLAKCFNHNRIIKIN